jgi:hypothetical protein
MATSFVPEKSAGEGRVVRYLSNSERPARKLSGSRFSDC